IAGLILLLTLITWIVAASGLRQVPSSSGIANRFIGTWRLVSITINGKTDPIHGLHPTGVIYYDGAGHMAAQIMPDRLRPKYVGPEPTADEAKVAITGYIAYFGTYTVDESARTVTHHRAGNLTPGSPVDAVRRYEFVSDDRLILRPIGIQ